MSKSQLPAILLCHAALVVTFLGDRSARAAEPPAPAQLAFDEGRRLEDAGDLASAVARFEESERLDPALGTVLNLANCYEQSGRLASAWHAFNRGAAEAAALHEDKRARRARDRADALVPKLSKLVIDIQGDAASDEELRIDGALLDRADWGHALPVDGGTHDVVARAPGRIDWSVRAQIASEGQAVTVTVPPLASSAVSEPPQVEAPLDPSPAEISTTAVPSKPSPVLETRAAAWTPLRIGGVATTGVGLVAVGLGVGYGLQARFLWSERQAQCSSNLCNDAGYTLTSQAREAATKSTVGFAIGGVGVVAGVALFVFAPRARKGAVAFTGEMLPGGASMRVSGAF